MNELDPKEVARIQANVAKMRAQGAPEQLIIKYLQHEQTLLARQPTEITARDIARSAGQGASYGFSDELGLADRDKQKAFQANHPAADFLAKLAGGSVAPIVASIVGPPALAGVGGAAAMGGATGLLTGVGEGETPGERTMGGLVGGALGAAGGVAAHGIAGGMRMAADRVNPERAVVRGANDLLQPNDAPRMDEINAIAPGGVSVATLSKSSKGRPRFGRMVSGIGANAKAARQGEEDVLGQLQNLNDAARRIGANLDAVDGPLPDTPELRVALAHARDVLGLKKIPRGKISLQEARDVLTQLRELNPSGAVSKRALRTARESIRDVLYDHEPQFADLDKQYALVMDQTKQARKILNTIESSRENYSGNKATKTPAASLGGSIAAQGRSMAKTLVESVFLDKAGSADAIGRLVVKPGGPEMVKQLISKLPANSPALSRIRAGLLSAQYVPAARSLFSTPEQPY